MLNNRLIFSFLLVVLPFCTKAQDQLIHEKKVFVSPDGKIFVNKSSPVYFRVATSPDENAPSYLLHSEVTSQYSNPMYLDTEGKNTLRSPSAVDTSTKKIVKPLRDVLFEMYADGIAPSTNANILNVNRHMVNKTVFYGKNMNIKFLTSDEISGVEASFVSVNQSPYQKVSGESTSFGEERAYSVKYYSVDHVGNVEIPKSLDFRVDLSAPKTNLSIIGENKGKVLSSKASISLSSKDTLSGVNRIVYTVNGGAEKTYTSPIPLSVLKDGETKISYYAIDNVGNVEDVKVISTSTAKPGNENESTYSFYIDKEAPVVSFEVIGDQYKGSSLFISDRSRIKVDAIDEKSGVEKIYFSQNNPLPAHAYSAPLKIEGEGVESFSYAASDYVGNYALAQVQQVYVDKTSPKSALSFIGKQFYNRDTLFITGATKLSIASIEKGSGVQMVTYTMDGKQKGIYKSQITIEEEGFHTLDFFATDNVNNTESTNSKSFFVDNIAPAIHWNFSVKAIGEKTIRGESYAIYPSNTMLYIAATDNASGGESIEYKINGKQVQSAIPIKGFIPGNYEIEITAWDVLKNKTSQVLRFSIEN